ncbi:MAG: hypothetical protein JNK42_04070 [Caedimonas sp.]|nr:hypothetical protein [Caedimonas sp.]
MKNMDNPIQKSLKETGSSEDKEIQELSENEEDLKKRMGEERLIWTLCLIILFNILFLRDCQNWSLPILIGILELFLIITLGQRLNINFISVFIDKVLEVVKK